MIVSTKRTQSRRSRKGKAKAQPRDRTSLSLLRKLDDLMTSTMINPTPMLRDVPKQIIAKERYYSVKQVVNVGSISLSTTAPTFGAIYANLSGATNSGSFTGIFDAWKITQMTVRFVPQSVPVSGGVYPPLLTVIDYDDANLPTSLSALREYDTFYESRYGSYQERTLVPKFAVAAYSGSFTSYAQSSGWVDIASPGVQWYGLKWGVDLVSATSANAYTIELEVNYVFKSVR